MKKRHNTFDYERNRKRVNRKKKKIPDIKCEQIKNAWDMKKSIKKNLKDMGISTDPNKTLKLQKNVPKSALYGDVMEVEIEQTPIKKFVLDELESTSKLPHKKKITMSDEEAGFCVYMMDKHGDDYEAMMRDRRNHYQETVAKIRKKILRFKSIPEMYEMYAGARQETYISATEDLLLQANTSSTSDFSLVQSSPPSPQSVLGMTPHRYSTRRYDAGLRNGHFFSPELSSPSNDATIFAPHATLCRVRRRLQFGRKAPKDRNGPYQDSL